MSRRGAPPGWIRSQLSERSDAAPSTLQPETRKRTLKLEPGTVNSPRQPEKLTGVGDLPRLTALPIRATRNTTKARRHQVSVLACYSAGDGQLEYERCYAHCQGRCGAGVTESPRRRCD